MKTLIAIVLGFAISQLALATTFRKVAVSEMYEESQAVVYGRIESGRILKSDCGVEYAIRVVNSFKGKSKPGDLLWFQDGGATQIGSEYFLFLSATGKEFSPITSTNSGAMDMRARYIARCKDKRPPLEVNVFGNGALKTTGTYNKSVPRAVLIDDVVIIPPSGLKVTKFKPSDRYDNDRNDTALDVEKFMAYMKTLSQRG